MFVEQAMVTPVITITPETAVARAWTLMRDWRCRHLPVLTEGSLVGIVSDRDLRAALARGSARDAGQSTVEAIMQRGVVTITPRASIADAIRELLKHRVGALPVMDEGRVVGIVTRSDLMQLLDRMLGSTELSDRVALQLDAEAAFGDGVLAAFSD